MEPRVRKLDLQNALVPLVGNPHDEDPLLEAIGDARVEPLERSPLWLEGEPPEAYPTGE